MDQRLKEQADLYDLESLIRSLKKHDENRISFETTIQRQEDTIIHEEDMISVINRPDNTTNEKLVLIDTERLRDNIARHRQEVALFKNEIKEEQARRRDTERMILYLEMKDAS